MILNFATIPAPYRHTAKQLCHGLLSGPHPDGERPYAIGTIRNIVSRLRRFFLWLAEHMPRRCLADLTTADLCRYNQALASSPLTPLAAGNVRSTIGLLWRYRHHLDDGLTVDPRHAEGWSTPAGTVAENRTARIPEQVLAPLLAWALRFTDDFAPDILTAVRARQAQLQRLAGPLLTRQGDILAQLDTYLQQHLNEAAPLPGLRGKPNAYFIGSQIGCQRSRLHAPAPARMIHETAAVVGVTDHTWLVPAITGQLAGQPWVDGIATHHPTQSVAVLARLLHTACYIVVAYFSGMRDSEIKHIRRGGVTTLRDSTGAAYRWRLTSRVFKGQHDPAGTPETWIIGAPASRAVAVLEELQPSGEDLLFRPLSRTQGRAADVINTPSTNRQLNEFVIWVNAYCARAGRADVITNADGGVFRLRSSQFRRTLAWFIARRPGGSIAGAIQYKHHGIQMFEGYAGTSRSGFRAEVESEQALLRGDHLTDIATTYYHDLAGPAAEEARRRLDVLTANPDFPGLVLADPVRARRFLARHEPDIYPGTYATCVFTAATARCLPPSRAAASTVPALERCHPLECANVALTPGNAAALQREHDRLESALTDPASLPPLLAHRLRRRQHDIARLLASKSMETS
ncbi:hypothetical protein ACIA5G_52445 [Amycolatopsis sp. NPDC051758]|uniref:hypothetical protein n=1 Tax=Amycolatopsis sp. NPDC051758 TaxID=3363935 RepID=UPI00378E5657